MGGGDPDMVPYATQKRDQYKAMNGRDFETAIRFGATSVRVGSAVFGARS